MSHWKASAAAREVPPDTTRDALTSALETIFWIAGSLDCEPNEGSILDAIEGLQADVKEADENVDKLETERDEALEKRAKELDQSALYAMQKERDYARSQRDSAGQLLAEQDVKLLHYEAAVQAARKLVAAADGAKPKRVKS